MKGSDADNASSAAEVFSIATPRDDIDDDGTRIERDDKSAKDGGSFSSRTSKQTNDKQMTNK